MVLRFSSCTLSYSCQCSDHFMSKISKSFGDHVMKNRLISLSSVATHQLTTSREIFFNLVEDIKLKIESDGAKTNVNFSSFEFDCVNSTFQGWIQS